MVLSSKEERVDQTVSSSIQVGSRDKDKTKEESIKLFSAAVEEAPNGVQIAEIKGRHVDEMNADPEFASKVILPDMKTGRWAGELMIKHKDGRIFPIWLTASLIKDNRGG